MTTVLKGGRIVDSTGERTGDVVLGDDGRIAAVGTDLSADITVDCGGCVIGPGLVDLHAHLREPGREEAETIESGSRAAALGGYTAVVAMPNTEPAIDCAAVVREVLDLGARPRWSTCTPPARSPSAAAASSSRRWPRWPRWGCACSPTTAAACRTCG